jgi:uncharacterized membrane protein YvlD (DUF360 family)
MKDEESTEYGNRFSIFNLFQSPLHLALSAVANCLLVYALDRYLPQYVSVFGGPAAFVIIGSLLTLLNLFVRPFLNIITLPFRLVFTLFTTIAVNALFLWLVYELTLKMNPNVLALAITGGITGWIVVSFLLGFANWLIKVILPK